MRSTDFYEVWKSMKSRVCNKKSERYHHYGGRGITISEEWKSFINFRDDMYESFLLHKKKNIGSNTTLERIDNNGSYSKENCRWATHHEQCRNQRTNLVISYKSKKLILKDWSKVTGIKYLTLYQRLYSYGWSVERTLSTKVK